MNTMLIQVPDVAVDISASTLTFKIVVSPEDDRATVLFRTFKQVEWLHDKLVNKHRDLFIPPFPEKPTSYEADYIEKKRLQVERFLRKIFSRKEIVEDGDTQYFLSEAMTPLDISNASSKKSLGQGKKSSITGLLGFVLKTDYHQGFRVFVASEYVVEGIDDQDEFLTRKNYILTMENNFNAVVDATSKMIKLKESLARVTHNMGAAFAEHLSEANFTSVFQEFTLKSKQISHDKTRNEVFSFGDIMLEYSHSMISLKRLMNERTDVLVDYVEACKTKAKKFEKVQKLKLKGSVVVDEELAAVEEQNQADLDVDKKKKLFEQVKVSLTREFVRFEKDKSRDIRQALKDYAAIQVKYETQKTDLLKDVLAQLDSMKPQPQ
ncbi:hypothetical protein MP638_003222 [Amoeboaphelidium occidentale]|nr:hypothetical protein MP638_003222 [Amoeboaphelidium occidentale]